METSSLIFITGGVRSGKSGFAEVFACEKATVTGGALHYLAPGVPSDSEMEKRIKRHQEERARSHFNWQTWEQPKDIGKLSSFFTASDILVLDCLTTLLNNELFTYETEWNERVLNAILYRIKYGISSLAQSCQQLIVVSNEVLHDETFLDNELVLKYSWIIGQLHQSLVKKAEKVYLVEFGVPRLLKGDAG